MIETGTTIAGRLALLRGEVQPHHRFKMALYTANASLGKRTKVYSPVNEVVGAGYEAILLGQPVYGVEEDVPYLDFPDTVVWYNATISAAGCIIYDASLDNLVLSVVDFGGVVSSTNDDFTVTPETRIIRFP